MNAIPERGDRYGKLKVLRVEKSEKYGVRIQTVQAVIARRTWRHL